MTSPGAAERHQEDGDPVPGPEDLCAKADATLQRLWDRLEGLTSQRADPALLLELLGAGLHCEELRQELARFAVLAGTSESLIEMGRMLERQAQAQEQAPRPRSRHARSRHPYLRIAGAAAVAAASVAGGAGIAVHDESAQGPVVSLPSPHAALRAAGLVPARAVLVPSPVASGPRRALELHGAAPAPSPSVSVPVAAPPPPPLPSAPAPQPPGFLVADSTALDLGVLGAGSVTITAQDGPVSWSASDVPGLEVWPSSGTLQDGESVTVTFRVLDQPQAGFGIVDLGDGVSVTVSWPAVTLPSP